MAQNSYVSWVTAKKMFAAPERTFERGRGCWNCLSYENGTLCRQHWGTHKLRLLYTLSQAAPLVRLGEMEKPKPGTADARREQIEQMDKAITTGVVGMCMKGARPQALGGPEGDFVEHRFLCDRWDAKQGASIATSGKLLDKLSDELADIALDRANPNRS